MCPSRVKSRHLHLLLSDFCQINSRSYATAIRFGALQLPQASIKVDNHHSTNAIALDNERTVARIGNPSISRRQARRDCRAHFRTIRQATKTTELSATDAPPQRHRRSISILDRALEATLEQLFLSDFFHRRFHGNFVLGLHNLHTE